MWRVNEIMADHVGFFAAEPGRSFYEMIAYVDTYRDPFGVELICATVRDTERVHLVWSLPGHHTT